MSKLIKKSDLAKRLGTSNAYITILCKQGKLATKKVAGVTFVIDDEHNPYTVNLHKDRGGKYIKKLKLAK